MYLKTLLLINYSMKKIVLILFFFIYILGNNSFAQKKETSGRKIYSSWGLEWIFSKTDFNINSEKDIIRFSVWFNFQSYWHYDFNKNIGLSWGVGLKNLGYIQKLTDNNIYIENYTHWNSTEKKYIINKGKGLSLSKLKRISYMIDFPLLLRIGNLKKSNYVFLGVSLAIPFYYKEKSWIDNEKKVYTTWFTDKLNMFLPITFVAYQFSFGMSMKISYSWKGIMNPLYKIEKQFVYEDKPFIMFSIGTYMFSVDKKLNKRF